MKRVAIFTTLSRLTCLAALCLILNACGSTDKDETSPTLTFNGVFVDGVPSAETTTPNRTLSGNVESGATIEITIGDTAVPDTDITVETNGSWSSPITLQPGANLVTVSASDATGNQSLFSLALTYDAVSIETYATPIPSTPLVVGGLIDPDLLVSPTLTISLPDGTELPIAPSDVTVTDATWSATLTGLQEGANVLKASVNAAGSLVEPTVTITVDSAAPVVMIDQPPFARIVVPSQTLTGTSDSPATSLTTVPLSAGNPIVDSGTGAWSASIEGLKVGKNPVTVTVTADSKTVTVRTLLFVDQLPPLVDSVSPAQNAVGIAADVVVSAVFNAEMDSNTVKTGFTLQDSSNATVDAVFNYDEVTRTATLTPTSPLVSGATYTAELAISITDFTGDPLKQLLSWDFTVQ